MVSKSVILETLIYSDIFDFPLTKDEIGKFLTGKMDKKSFEKELEDSKQIRFKNNFYYLLGREKIVEKRIERKKESQQKLITAKTISRILSLVPTVLFIGISGSLALENSDEKDDIDLFVITSGNTLWITRLILVISLILMGQYRGRGNPPAGGESNKICLNMLIDETALDFSKRPSSAKASAGKQNLYTAHEIIQLKLVFDRNNTFNKFLNANKWIDLFLPNARKRIKNPHNAFASRGRHESEIKNKKGPLFIIHYSLFILEKFSKFLQLLYMKRHRTKETISDHMLAFHPFEYKDHVLKEYNRRLRRYDPPSCLLRRSGYEGRVRLRKGHASEA
ncbi:MAG: hypothetical protein HYW62_02925 [Candidatus Levybacteria bacterium]|nr:hypothetical protein [Candidatus Levybacteria bacterium]